MIGDGETGGRRRHRCVILRVGRGQCERIGPGARVLATAAVRSAAGARDVRTSAARQTIVFLIGIVRVGQRPGGDDSIVEFVFVVVVIIVIIRRWVICRQQI